MTDSSSDTPRPQDADPAATSADAAVGTAPDTAADTSADTAAGTVVDAAGQTPDDDRPIAVVTGASSGIGEATARRLVAEGFQVVAAARRLDRLEKLAAETGVRPLYLDVTDEDSVAALAEAVPRCAVLVNNAGGALGLDPVAQADVRHWQQMYEVNVLGSLRVTKALLPSLQRNGRGHVVNITSIAGLLVYEGGGGYTAAKHAQHAMTETLRLELNGKPIRITEIAPGMVRTDEFALVRFDGDAERAAATYRGVDEPLLAEDIADCVAFAVTRPAHVDIDLLVVKPVAQAAPHKVHRTA
jgi:NADP-dependent 3-hydroxy acid dehydrogenase YdfG